jgi:hypothetical protein
MEFIMTQLGFDQTNNLEPQEKNEETEELVKDK